MNWNTTQNPDCLKAGELEDIGIDSEHGDRADGPGDQQTGDTT